MYKDRERQKEASKEAMRRRRAGITKKGVNPQDVIPGNIIPEGKMYVYGEGGGRIGLEMLIEPSWRELFIYLKEHLREDLKGDLRIGIEGVTVKELDRLVEITA